MAGTEAAIAKYLSSLLQYGAKPGLERINRLTELLGRPQNNFASIHVGGTNGKGSTSLMLSRVLSAAGYQTGLFVSPHIHTYRERVQINGEMISISQFADCLSQVDNLLPTLEAEGHSHPTEFEVLTAAALLYFSNQAVDIAVIEVGMGGIYDSTNIVRPLVSIITNIELDHTAYLGNTITEIATNKAGIIKEGVPIITTERKSVALQVMTETAIRKGAELLPALELVKVKSLISEIYGQKVAVSGYGGEAEIWLGLPGAYQRDNLALVWTALQCLREQGLSISAQKTTEALATCCWPGRMELIGEDPIIILDAGHNAAGARAMTAALHEVLPGRGVVVVAGILDDKDAEPFLTNLPLETQAVVITRPDSPRAIKWRQRAELAEQYYNQVYQVELIEEAVQKGVELLNPGMVLVVTGSFYVLDRARKYLLNREIEGK
ncbi:MAG: bifunctional folylpolyglutamate synthase/dihydrofolate synthase [Methylocystaceae bacterium]